MKKNKGSWLTVGYSVFTVILMIASLYKQDSYAATQCIVALALLAVPLVIKWLTPICITTEVKAIYSLFCFATVICGSALGWYGILPYWDKWVHFASGFLMVLVGLAIYEFGTKGISLGSRWLKDVCVLSIAMAGAVIWEFYEYGLYIFLGIDALNVKTTGVHDTLQDMLVCTLGAITMLVLIRRKEKDSKPCYLLRVWERFKGANRHLFEKE